MVLFGHLGIGGKAVKLLPRLGERLPWKPVLLGCILPDLLDKPIYYGLSWWTGLSREALGTAYFGINGTKTFGHTLLLWALLLGLVSLAHKKVGRTFLLALALGIVSHLLIDVFYDSRLIVAALWPLLGWQFPVLPHASLGAHLLSLLRPEIFISELLGLMILIREAILAGWCCRLR